MRQAFLFHLCNVLMANTQPCEKCKLKLFPCMHCCFFKKFLSAILKPSFGVMSRIWPQVSTVFVHQTGCKHHQSLIVIMALLFGFSRASTSPWDWGAEIGRAAKWFPCTGIHFQFWTWNDGKLPCCCLQNYGTVREHHYKRINPILEPQSKPSLVS